MGFSAGERALIVGAASKLSIASGIAAVMHRESAELTSTYQNDKLKSQMEEFASGWDSRLELCSPCDMVDDSRIEAVFAALGEHWDDLDIIVHSIGFVSGDQLGGDFTTVATCEDFRVTHDTSIYSSTIPAEAGREMMKGRNGSLLILSYLGTKRTTPSYDVMGMAKANLEVGARYLAGNLDVEGIRVSAVSVKSIRASVASGIKSSRRVLAANERQMPLRRNVIIEEVGSADAFLCSNLASGISGEIPYVDGSFNTIAMGLLDDD